MKRSIYYLIALSTVSIPSMHNAHIITTINGDFAAESEIHLTRHRTPCFFSAKKVLIKCLYLIESAFLNGNLTVGGNELISGNLTVNGSQLIEGNLTVEGIIFVGAFTGDLTLIGTPQQACIIFRDNTLTEKARICSSPIPGDNGVFVSVDGGATQNLRVTDPGGVVIATPSSGVALTIDGGGQTIVDGDLQLLSGDLILPVAGASGLIQLGGTNTLTNVMIYEFGNRNLFATNGVVNLGVTGSDNISIGTLANSSLIIASNAIAIGSSARAIATDSISIGNTANTSSNLAFRSIILGSRDTSSTGAAPTTGVVNAIVIGSARGTLAGAFAGRPSATALGGSNGVFAGATASGATSVALGAGTTAAANFSIAIGNASTLASGLGANASNDNAIAIGSASGTFRGANATNISSIAIGSADTNFAGASATGTRTIALGFNATASGINAIAIGSASGTVGGTAATASTTNAIAIGSGQAGLRGALVLAGIGAVAIGGSSGAVAGALGVGTRSVAIGNGATAASTDTMVLGNTGLATYRVGIGFTAPNSKLHIVGEADNPVIRLAAGSTLITSQPVWTNRFTQGIMGTPIHFDASGRFFGFTSSARYKQNIRNITDESEILYKLNPVIYDAKEGHGEGKDIPGFIAEQVFEVAPNLSVLNSEGQPENVAYNALHALAIKQIQNHQQQLDQQQATLAARTLIIKSIISFAETAVKESI